MWFFTAVSCRVLHMSWYSPSTLFNYSLLSTHWFGQFLVATRSVWLNKMFPPLPGAQGKQRSNCAVGLQWPVLLIASIGKVPACGVWLKLKLVCHLAEPSTLWKSAKVHGAFLQKIKQPRINDESSPKVRIQHLTVQLLIVKQCNAWIGRTHVMKKNL